MKTKKAGCFLIDLDSKKVALVYRDKKKDYTFPKGHLEENETLIECAIRETAEETKRIAKIIDNEPLISTYTTPSGEDCICYMYIALDCGKSDNDSLDTHDVYWINIDEVENVLSYESLIQDWKKNKNKIITIITKSTFNI